MWNSHGRKEAIALTAGPKSQRSLSDAVILDLSVQGGMGGQRGHPTPC